MASIEALDGTRSVPDHGAERMRRNLRTPAVATAVVMLLAMAVCASAGNGPGIALKMGVQTFESPVSLRDTTRTRYELEISSQLFANERLDFALSVGGSSLGTHRDYYAEIVDGALIEESYKDVLSLLDIRLAARLHPFGQDGPLRPYLGAGIGYFWFLDSWSDRYYETIEDPYYPGYYITYADRRKDTDTVADGFFPFVMAGLNVAVSDNAELLFEFQYDIEKKDSGFDFGGPIYMFGARFRF